MRQLVQQTLDWIDRAPMKVEARAESKASPDAVFRVLADHMRWPEWFPSVRSVTVTGPAEGVGARRRVEVPGVVVEEEFIAWEPGTRWSFTGTAARPHFTRSLVEDCVLTPLASGGTAIGYTMYLDPPPLFRVLMNLSRPRIAKNNTKAMQNLARRAEAATA